MPQLIGKLITTHQPTQTSTPPREIVVQLNMNLGQQELGVDGSKLQGGRIMGNQGTRFPGNPNVSQEILIVNPAHLSQKCDTPKKTQTW